ncbi:uracil-DNA glycosylase [Leuconostocaceae bacterium ESL0958]|nr:uracil-DNA glycosylase [Leuconostocaceae bacterium ESL0958]
MPKQAALTGTDWDCALAPYLPADYAEQVGDFLNQVYGPGQHTYPARSNVFAAFEATPLAKTEVVLLGQDPYHGPNQAQGLSFSVPNQVPAPPSLRNIRQELVTDLGQEKADHDLTPWAKQGVLLLNAVLTVPAGQANGHQGLIWEALTDAAIQAANADDRPKVFLLWGKFAQHKAKFIDQDKHLILQAPHPSPLSAYRGFFGSRPFSQANRFLLASGRQPIDWTQAASN